MFLMLTTVLTRSNIVSILSQSREQCSRSLVVIHILRKELRINVLSVKCFFKKRHKAQQKNEESKYGNLIACLTEERKRVHCLVLKQIKSLFRLLSCLIISLLISVHYSTTNAILLIR